MEVTIFKDITAIDTPFHKPVSVIFERIKKGNSKELVQGIRKEKDSDTRNRLKKKLPSICFSGKFTKREDSSLLEHSGLICLDFDKFESKEEMKTFNEFIRKDKYTFASFVSPSGNGYKVVVKIPKEPANHKMYFDALKDYYDSDYFDTTSKNISRVCYESYDPRLFVNEDSEIWDTKAEYEQFSITERNPVIPVTDTDEKIKALMVWFNKKYSMSTGERNNNLYILAASFNQYGVSKTDALSFCSEFQDKDFTMTEIERTINSAYSNFKEFGTKYFENSKAVDTVSRKIRSGVNKKEIKKYLHDQLGITNDRCDEAIAEIEKDTSVNEFWRFDQRGNVKIINHKFKYWLEQNGFYKFYPEGSDSFVFVRVKNNLVSDTSEAKIKDFVLNHLEKKDSVQVYEFFAERSKYFKEDHLSFLSNVEVRFNQDSSKEAFLYFKNKAVRVTEDKVELVDYMHLNGYVWEKHIIDRDFEPTKDFECDYSKFIFNISGKDEKKEASIRSTAGYLLHSHKTSAKNVAVILNDETISENPNGGTGKGIFINALMKMKRLVVIDGKTHDQNRSFPYQTVSADTQVLVFDDVKKNFNFENLFSLITEGITLEKKNRDAIKLPIDKSPKILISTNYAIKGDGNSFDRRKWDLEFAQYYTKDFTPENEFGRLLFDDWDVDEWNKFDNYMVDSLKLYLKEGLIQTIFNNLDIRRFIAKTNFDFYEWAEDGNLPVNIRMYRNEKFNQFVDENKEAGKWLTQKRFSKWIEDYGYFKGYKIFNGRTSTSRWVQYDDGNEYKQPEEELQEAIDNKLPF